MSSLLTGIRIIDLTRLLPGPYATLRLAEMGAEVIKVEDVNSGDPARHTGPSDPSGQGVVFLANHREKQSRRFDLRSTAGRQQLLDLIASADVVMESFRPGRMKQFGLDYDTLRDNNPAVILCSLTGYGQKGPLAQRAGHDLNYMATSGMLALLAGPSAAPHPAAVQIADMVGGLAASEAVLAALIERNRTGRGQHMDVSMTAALLGLLPTHAAIQSLGLGSYGVDELTGSRICYQIYQTRDNAYVALGALEPKFWQSFCDSVNHPEWIPKQFEPAVPKNETYTEVKSEFLQRTQREWMRFADETDCCLSPVHDVPSAIKQAEDLQLTNLVQSADVGFTSVSTHAGGFVW